MSDEEAWMMDPTRSKGHWGMGADFAIGSATATLFAVLGYLCNRLDCGDAGRVFLWPSYLLWWLFRAQFIEHQDAAGTVYAGLPYLVISIIGVLISFPIYVCASWGLRRFCHSVRFSQGRR